MALSDQWTLADLTAVARRELLDPNATWWSDTEIQGYLNEWQQQLQSQFDFVWATNTVITTVSTFTLGTFTPPMMRLDAIYYTPGTTTTVNGTFTNTLICRLSPRSLIDLDVLQRDWRALGTVVGYHPQVSYQYDVFTVSVWPENSALGTFVFEYPVLLTMTASTDPIQIPAWTRYSAAPFVCYKAFKRFGPNQDIPKAQRRLTQFNRQVRQYRKFYDNYFPERAEMLRPGRKYAGNILVPRQNNLQVP